MAKYNVKNAPRRVRLRWLKKAQAARKYYSGCRKALGVRQSDVKEERGETHEESSRLPVGLYGPGSISRRHDDEEDEVPMGTSNNPWVSRGQYRREARKLRAQGYRPRVEVYGKDRIYEEYGRYPQIQAQRMFLPEAYSGGTDLRRMYHTKNPGLSEGIRAGDKVTIADRFGKLQTGRAVMRSSMGGWVLNMGGRYGTPALADDQNIVRVGGGRSRGHNPELLVMTNPGTLRVGKHGRTGLMKRHRRRHRRYNSWRGQSRRHAVAARKGWSHRRRGRKAHRYSKRAHKKHVRMGGRKYSWKGLVKRMGVKKAHLIWRKRAKNPRRHFRRSRR